MQGGWSASGFSKVSEAKASEFVPANSKSSVLGTKGMPLQMDVASLQEYGVTIHGLGEDGTKVVKSEDLSSAAASGKGFTAGKTEHLLNFWRDYDFPPSGAYVMFLVNRGTAGDAHHTQYVNFKSEMAKKAILLDKVIKKQLDEVKCIDFAKSFIFLPLTEGCTEFRSE